MLDSLCSANRNLIPASQINQALYHAGFAHHILVDRTTGHIFLHAPILELQFPMLIVRHGETEANRNMVLQGHADGPDNQLNAAGRTQAQSAAQKIYEQLAWHLGNSLHNARVSERLIILTSPLKRAQETAIIFLEYLHIKTGIMLHLQVEPGLIEKSFGIADGFSLEEIEDQHIRELVRRYRSQDATVNWNGTGESFLDVIVRAKTFLETLNQTYHEQDHIVVAFSHGILTSALRTVVGENSILNDDKMIAFRNKSLNHAEPHWLGQSQKLIAQFKYS